MIAREAEAGERRGDRRGERRGEWVAVSSQKGAEAPPVACSPSISWSAVLAAHAALAKPRVSVSAPSSL